MAAVRVPKKKTDVPEIGLRESTLVLPYTLLRDVQDEIGGRLWLLETKGTGSCMVGIVSLHDVPLPFVRAIQAKKETPKAVKEALQKFLDLSQEEALSLYVTTPHEAYGALRFLTDLPVPALEFELNGNWYPVPFTLRFFRGWFLSECALSIDVGVQDQSIEREWYISERSFLSGTGHSVKKTLLELLEGLGLRPTTNKHVTAFRDKLLRLEQMEGRTGLMVDVAKSVLVEVALGWKDLLLPYGLGSAISPKTLIIETELEAARNTANSRSEKIYTLPFLRAFSLKLKKYVYVDVDDVKEHVHRPDVRHSLVLPLELRTALDAVFDTPPDQVFGDLFDGRHGGVVLLAAGGPGVGKTLTAEVYAESTKRPLYVMEMGELGTSLEAVEANLQKIFDRARRWNAVLLLDEADIFLSKREDSDLERGAIVATFLRLLDYHEGTFFLTTNREEVIDEAFRSRVTLRLAYPDLAEKSRTRVWEQLLHKAGLSFSGDMEELARENLNGRNIRNTIRILKMFYPTTGAVTTEQINRALSFISRPKQ